MIHDAFPMAKGINRYISDYPERYLCLAIIYWPIVAELR